MQIYNSMTRKKEEFKPIHEGKVGIYACGPTVYNYFHIGNARPFIIFDVLRRYLEYRGYEVTFVQNFTDIDDKMIRKANEEGVTVKEIADRYIQEYFVDAKALGIRPATVHPRATEHMPQIIAMIQKLVDNGLAFCAARIWKIWKAAHGSVWTSRRKTRWTSPCGRRRSPANPHGKARGVWAAPAGTSSAPP